MFVLKGILRAETQEKILIYILLRGSGYSSEIARYFNVPLNPVQKQMVKLETDGVIKSHSIGRVRNYQLNKDYPFLSALKVILHEAIEKYPMDIIDNLKLDNTAPEIEKPPEANVPPALLKQETKRKPKLRIVLKH